MLFRSSGRTEVLETLFGLRPASGGAVFMKGAKAKIRKPADAMRLGMAMLTEERRENGIIPMLDIAENILVVNYHSFVGRLGFIRQRKANEAALEYTDRLRVKMRSLKELIQNLSGGNQQKVLLARWLLSNPDILLLDEPTRGIDVGAKAEIYSIMVELANQGKSIIMVSSELPEILKLSDAILVMHEGRVTGMLDRREASVEVIMGLAVS